MVNYAWAGRSQRKLWWRAAAILTLSLSNDCSDCVHQMTDRGGRRCVNVPGINDDAYRRIPGPKYQCLYKRTNADVCSFWARVNWTGAGVRTEVCCQRLSGGRDSEPIFTDA